MDFYEKKCFEDFILKIWNVKFLTSFSSKRFCVSWYSEFFFIANLIQFYREQSRILENEDLKVQHKKYEVKWNNQSET